MALTFYDASGRAEQIDWRVNTNPKREIRRVWQPPSLHQGDEERSVGWLELFFDLFFVVVIAEIAHGLVEHPDARGVLSFLVLFVPVWWVWIGDTIYAERFETEGVESRLYAYALMLPVIGMAVFAHDALGATYAGFALSYALARLIITGMFAWGTFSSSAFRPTGVRFVSGFSLAIVLVVLSVFTGPPVRYVLFGLALLTDLVTPLSTVRLQAALPGFSTSKFPERFGLFTIIVLGETVVGVVNGLTELESFSPRLLTDAALGVALGFGLWWLYFDFIGRRQPQPGLKTFIWGYAHLPFVVAVTAIGAGITVVIGAEGALQREVQAIIGGFMSAALISLALLETVLRREPGEPTHPVLSPLLKVVTGTVALLAGFAMSGLSAVSLLLLLLVLLMVNMLYGLWVWFDLGATAKRVKP